MKILSIILFSINVVILRAETIQTIETDKQGQPHVTASTTTATTKLPDGREQTNTSTSRPNSSGKLVLDATATTVTTPAVNGVTTTSTTERRVDVNGTTQPDRQITERTTKINDTETHSDRTIQSVDHANGALVVTAHESSTTRVDGNKSTTETTIQKPTDNGWRDEGRVRTIETKAADGSVQREITESSRSQFDRATGSTGLGDSLQPRRKIIENEVQQADGSKIIDRQTYRRDVNGDWKPASYSSENGLKPIQ